VLIAVSEYRPDRRHEARNATWRAEFAPLVTVLASLQLKEISCPYVLPKYPGHELAKWISISGKAGAESG